MNDSIPVPSADSAESEPEPRLLTVAEAAKLCGLTPKVISGRMDRETLRVVRDDSGTRRVPRAELVRTGLLDPSHPGESGAESPSHPGELVIWRDLYEREREQREQAQERENELRVQLTAIANAGPIRALRLRRALRAREASVDLGPDGAVIGSPLLDGGSP
ncbi:MAG: hypothetical protein WAK93_19135 [Solirubrobacteraceae bacterium]